ncbi:uncharacterized protein LOC117507838 [Thalassophryne amazonica]|uniref:uncharacterized protein LOC117507838 n=1 Tax=Thalassophryne amazonica TaxID=390379 RepID=UPI00147119BE|nr:uncharacterized protein LOC117507838 [Thalassophryne amazonica]
MSRIFVRHRLLLTSNAVPTIHLQSADDKTTTIIRPTPPSHASQPEQEETPISPPPVVPSDEGCPIQSVDDGATPAPPRDNPEPSTSQYEPSCRCAYKKREHHRLLAEAEQDFEDRESAARALLDLSGIEPLELSDAICSNADKKIQTLKWIPKCQNCRKKRRYRSIKIQCGKSSWTKSARKVATKMDISDESDDFSESDDDFSDDDFPEMDIDDHDYVPPDEGFSDKDCQFDEMKLDEEEPFHKRRKYVVFTLLAMEPIVVIDR